jgi:hypothetical protein
MRLFPVLEEEYIVDEPMDEFIDRLSNTTDSHRKIRILMKNLDQSKLFHGYVDWSSFHIMRYITHGNSFNQVISGTLSTINDKTKINLVYHIDKGIRLFVYAIWMFMCLFFIALLAIDIYNIMNKGFSLFSLVIVFMFSMSLFIIRFGYTLDIEETRTTMRRFINRDVK